MSYIRHPFFGGGGGGGIQTAYFKLCQQSNGLLVFFCFFLEINMDHMFSSIVVQTRNLRGVVSNILDCNIVVAHVLPLVAQHVSISN